MIASAVFINNSRKKLYLNLDDVQARWGERIKDARR
jgi:hypothetical protein